MRGLVPIGAGVVGENIDCTISAVSPSTLNILGSTIVTITGTGFPAQLEN
jgi:hypothetical protein